MRRILLAAFSLIGLAASAQRNYWSPSSEADAGNNLFVARQRPGNFQLFRLQETGLKTDLQSAPSEKNVSAFASSLIITVPGAGGVFQHFKIVEAPVMDPQLSAKYPSIHSYYGKGVEDPSATIRFDVSPLGFHAMIRAAGKPTVFISPLDADNGFYMVASKADMRYARAFECLTKDVQATLPSNNINQRNADDAKLRTFRLAMAASGEFSQFWLNGTEADDAARRTKVLAAQNMLITRCNGIFESDFGMRVVLIGNNDDIIYLNAGSDPWPGSGYNSQTQTTIDAEIGSANYDIGHLVDRTGNGGDAGCIGCVCTNGSKGSGFTSLAGSNWSDDAAVIDFLPHEIGHQFGGNHTFSHDNEGPTIAQVEPGSGSTIMGYAGITGALTDVQPHSDDFFHAVSIQQITDYIKAAGCAAVTNVSNTPPTANAGADFTIPKSTPFMLTGTGSDPDVGVKGDVLDFIWEEMDVANAFPYFPSTTATAGPAFRSYTPSASTSRVFPTLANILDGTNTNKWEKLPAVGRTLNFRFTVRDNHFGAGNNRSDDMMVTVNDATGPFQVTSPNTSVSWCPGAQTVTWDVAGTNGAPINVANVKISLSTDGGLSFPVVLAASTPNDGSASVTIPCTFSTTARIKVEAIGNIFFDISNANFTTGDNTKPTFTQPADITIYKDANCNHDASTGITGDVSDEDDNCDNTLNATPADAVAPGSCEGELVITRTWTLTDDCGNSTVKVQTITVKDTIAPTFTQPADITIYKDENCNHDASVAVTGDVTDEDDNCDNSLDATFSDVTVPGSCIGEEIITRTWTLMDDCGNSTSHNQVILVKDTTRPSITGVSPDPPVLWPPNHKMRPVTINYTAVDNCSPVTNSLSVTSNEPVDGTGDGNTSPDWEVIDDHHLLLRAERAGNGNGRIYTITITSVDDCGNTATATTTVLVPHSPASLTRTMGPGEIEEKATGFAVNVLPNPSNTGFVINITSDRKESVLMQVTDLSGRTVETKGVSGNGSTRIGDSYLPGVYLVRVMQGSNVRVLKLVKL